MTKILIGYDGSAGADAILEDLSHAGLPAELDAILMSVADVWLPPDSALLEPGFPEKIPPAVQAARKRARHELEAARALAEGACRRLRDLHPKWRLQAQACGDSPGWALVKKADAERADLVVVGSQGHSALERFFLGSVSQKVAAEANCSVRIARPRLRAKHTSLRLLVALEGSEDSDRAVQAVLARTWPDSTAVRVAAVIDPRLESALAWCESLSPRWFQEQDHGMREGVCRMLEHWSKRLAEAGFQAETVVHEGDPKREILGTALAWEADAVFLGARGLQHGGRLTLGTVVAAVAARAHCTVEIVRTQET